jgi:hypothetical protein
MVGMNLFCEKCGRERVCPVLGHYHGRYMERLRNISENFSPDMRPVGQ